MKKYNIELSDRKLTLLNIGSGIGVLIFNMGVNFLLSPYIVATLGEEANGFMQLANNFVSYVSLITIAFNSMAGRFVSISFHKGDLDSVNRIFSSAMTCNLVISVVLFPIMSLFVFNIDSWIRIENADITDVKLLFLCVFISFFIGLITSVYNISMFVKNVLYINNVFTFVRSVFYAGILLGLFSYLNPHVYFVSMTNLFLTIGLLILVYTTHRQLMPDLRFQASCFDWESVKKLLSSGVWNTVNQCGNMLMTGLDLLVANWFLSPSAMGVLAVAKIVPNAIVSLASTLNTNLAPSLTICWAKGNKEELLRVLKNNMKISSVLVSIPLMVFCAYGIDFYVLWMPSLDATQLTLLSFLTCMAFVPWSGPQVLNNIFLATNHLRVNTITFCVAGVINVILVYVLLKYSDFGIYAIAGTSSVITIIRCFFVTAPYIAYLVGVKWYTFYKDAGVSVLCCTLNYVISIGVHCIFATEEWLSLIASMMLSVMISFVVDLCIVLNQDERKILLKKVRRK